MNSRITAIGSAVSPEWDDAFRQVVRSAAVALVEPHHVEPPGGGLVGDPTHVVGVGRASRPCSSEEGGVSPPRRPASGTSPAARPRRHVEQPVHRFRQPGKPARTCPGEDRHPVAVAQGVRRDVVVKRKRHGQQTAHGARSWQRTAAARAHGIQCSLAPALSTLARMPLDLHYPRPRHLKELHMRAGRVSWTLSAGRLAHSGPRGSCAAEAGEEGESTGRSPGRAEARRAEARSRGGDRRHEGPDPADGGPLFSFGGVGFQEVETQEYCTDILKEERLHDRGDVAGHADGVDGHVGIGQAGHRARLRRRRPARRPSRSRASRAHEPFVEGAPGARRGAQHRDPAQHHGGDRA